MKKSILVLALISFALIFVKPQVNASDRDVGYKFNLPVDNVAVVAIDQVVMNVSYEYVNTVAESGDPPSLRAFPPKEGEKSANAQFISPSGCLSNILTDFCGRHGTRLKDTFTRYTNYSRIISTSNGGAGY